MSVANHPICHVPGLGGHTRRGSVKHDVRDEVDEVSKITQAGLNAGRNVTDAGKQLHAW